MPIYRLDERIAFPDPAYADDSGIVAIGGDLSVERLLLAYSLGVFPWFDEGQPILWHAPRRRMVLLPDEIYVGRSLRKMVRRDRFEIRYDTAFEPVIHGCAAAPRPGQDGTWITDDMREAYIELHARGYAHSAEAWLDDELVGGLYGVTLGGAFFGESMFSRVPDASKVAFVHCARTLASLGYVLIDCQVHTEHMERFGAREWRHDVFALALGRVVRLRPRARWPVTSPPGFIDCDGAATASSLSATCGDVPQSSSQSG